MCSMQLSTHLSTQQSAQCFNYRLLSAAAQGIFAPGRQVQKATLIAVGISSLKIPTAFLIRSGAQQNFAYPVHIRAHIPYRTTVSDFQLT